MLWAYQSRNADHESVNAFHEASAVLAVNGPIYQLDHGAETVKLLHRMYENLSGTAPVCRVT